MFAGIPVRHYRSARLWYERLLGTPPSMFPHESEAVWEVAEHRYLYIVQEPHHAGHARILLFINGLDTLIGKIETRGLKPSKLETPSKGVQKVTFCDPDGNEIAFGGATRKVKRRS